MKQCTKCKLEYPATAEYFTSNRRASDGLHYYCKACHRAYTRQLRSTPEGLEKCRAAGRKSTNKRRHDGRHTKALHAKPLLAAKSKLWSLLYVGRCACGWSQASKIGMLYGCSFEFLIRHLESTLPNHTCYPEVHIDHIVPLATATTIEELEALQHWSNLQWLPGPVNAAKGATLSEDWQDRKAQLLRRYTSKYDK